MELRPFRAVHREPPYKERRPALWIDRQAFSHSDGSTTVVPLLIGLVRVVEKGILLPVDGAAADSVSRRVGALVSAKADAEPCLLVTRAPLEAALSTSRPADEIVTDSAGVRHDLIRLPDYARHVELQGLVKNAEAQLAAGRELWEAGRQFSVSPAAVKLPGARFKLCAIVDERSLGETRPRPEALSGILGFSFEDAVY
jgi:hypothetical protein